MSLFFLVRRAKRVRHEKHHARERPKKRETITKSREKGLSRSNDFWCENCNLILQLTYPILFFLLGLPPSFFALALPTLTACFYGGGGPQVGEVTRLGGVKNNLRYMQSYKPVIPGCTFSKKEGMLLKIIIELSLST